MKRVVLAVSGMVLGVLLSFDIAASQTQTSEPDWSVNMTVMETCSCPLFCQCFFTGKPPVDNDMGSHGKMEMKGYCRFNQAYKVNNGHFGLIRLDGAMFWFAGDAGEDFALPKLDWALLTFDSSVTKEQKEGLLTILHHLHFYRPERWRSYGIAKSAAMTWSFSSDSAKASLDRGRTAEVILRRLDGGMNERPVTLNNMDYFGYPHNTGFLLMPNEVEAYRAGDKAFEYRGTNGLVTTVEISSKDIKK